MSDEQRGGIPPYVEENLDDSFSTRGDQPDDGYEVPAGGAGADAGAVDAVDVDPTDEAEVQNISSANDTPGVGTRGADGEMEVDRG